MSLTRGRSILSRIHQPFFGRQNVISHCCWCRSCRASSLLRTTTTASRIADKKILQHHHECSEAAAAAAASSSSGPKRSISGVGIGGKGDVIRNAVAVKDSDWNTFLHLTSYVWPSTGNDRNDRRHKQRVVASLALMISGKVVTIQIPYVFKHLVDALPLAAASTTASAAADPTLWMMMMTSSTSIGSILIAYGISRAAATGLQEYRSVVFSVVAQDAIRTVGRKVFDHMIQQLDLQYHLSRNTGQLARILDRGQRSINFVLNAMVFHIGPTVLEVSLVTGLVWYQFGLPHAAVVLGTVAAYTRFTLAFTEWRTKVRREMNRLDNEASGRVVDSLLNYETVQYFGNAKHEGERYEASLTGYQKASLESQYSLSLLNFGQSAIFSLGLTAVMGLTAQQIVLGTASVGDMVLVNGLLFQLSVPLFFIGSVYREVKQSFVDMEAMFKITDTQSKLIDSPNSIALDTNVAGTTISFDNVHFSYPTATQRPILNGTSFQIAHGQTVAFVGSSGCGKSTILRLLYRFYDPERGCITIGGQSTRDVTKDSLQRAIAVVPQDIVLFNESIMYNIRYGNLNATRDDVIHVAQQARIHDTILGFEKGYDTIVGERGLKLSGGEKQRISIARAILKGAPILLCDEPTSSLDGETELEIMNNLKAIGSDRTTIIIAHRLSTVQDCDKIFVMDNGMVVEEGTHEQLLQRNGRYTELLKMQEGTEV